MADIRPIDANALNVKFEELKNQPQNTLKDIFFLDGAMSVVDAASTLDYAPVRHGSVIETNVNGKSHRVFTCCGTDFTTLTMWMIPNYCPNCGAKMDGGKDDG